MYIRLQLCLRSQLYYTYIQLAVSDIVVRMMYSFTTKYFMMQLVAIHVYGS